jgi:ubiquinone/menaquinone biosynthesis methyltransferase
MPAPSIAESIGTPAAKKAYNQDLFTRVAAEYDIATRAMSLGRDAAWKRQLVASLPDHIAPRCLDLATGTGDVAFELANRYPDAEILGLDLTPAMIDEARKRNGSRADRVRFEVGDMCATGLPDHWADLITGSYALRNAPTLEAALVEIRRVLKPGGRAAFLDFAKSSNQLLQELQLALLKGWGGLWGMIVHGRPEHAYIAESLRLFPDRVELRHRLADAGFTLERTRPFYFGALELMVLRPRR